MAIKSSLAIKAGPASERIQALLVLPIDPDCADTDEPSSQRQVGQRGREGGRHHLHLTTGQGDINLLFVDSQSHFHVPDFLDELLLGQGRLEQMVSGE